MSCHGRLCGSAVNDSAIVLPLIDYIGLGETGNFGFHLGVENNIMSGMNNLSNIYKKPFFACILCIIYAAASWGMALFGF